MSGHPQNCTEDCGAPQSEFEGRGRRGVEKGGEGEGGGEGRGGEGCASEGEPFTTVGENN